MHDAPAITASTPAKLPQGSNSTGVRSSPRRTVLALVALAIAVNVVLCLLLGVKTALALLLIASVASLLLLAVVSSIVLKSARERGLYREDLNDECGAQEEML